MPDWLGPIPDRVAAHVPPDVERAIVAYETAMERRAWWNYRYTNGEERTQYALDQCKGFGRLAEWWWSRLGDLLPMEAGWWPHDGHIYGWAKRGKGGFELVRRRAWEPMANPAAARRQAMAVAERRRAEGQLREFCSQHRR